MGHFTENIKGYIDEIFQRLYLNACVKRKFRTVYVVGEFLVGRLWVTLSTEQAQ